MELRIHEVVTNLLHKSSEMEFIDFALGNKTESVIKMKFYFEDNLIDYVSK